MSLWLNKSGSLLFFPSSFSCPFIFHSFLLHSLFFFLFFFFTHFLFPFPPLFSMASLSFLSFFSYFSVSCLLSTFPLFIFPPSTFLLPSLFLSPFFYSHYFFGLSQFCSPLYASSFPSVIIVASYIPRILYSFCYSSCSMWKTGSWECGYFSLPFSCVIYDPFTWVMEIHPGPEAVVGYA